MGGEHLRAHAEEPAGGARVRGPHEDAGQSGESPAVVLPGQSFVA